MPDTKAKRSAPVDSPELALNLAKRKHILLNFKNQLRFDKIFLRIGATIQAYIHEIVNDYCLYQVIDYRPVNKNYEFEKTFSIPMVGDIKIKYSCSQEIFNAIR